ncbi:hypothetical protein BJX66DRAFT_320875 [Aspergillus keveii]|uniref:Secreted protein n=1 Tax=Aspergillus keveii TaxID=714993 RepID=A0ABR4FGK8_9EURO
MTLCRQTWRTQWARSIFPLKATTTAVACSAAFPTIGIKISSGRYFLALSHRVRCLCPFYLKEVRGPITLQIIVIVYGNFE